MCSWSYEERTKTSSRWTDDIKALSEWLGSLQITEEASNKYKQTTTENMLIAPVLMAGISQENGQAELPKNMVPDLGWFDGDQTKFEDWWRGIWLFLKSNKVIETDNRITAILARFKRGVVGIYAQKKLDELDEKLGTQD